MKTGRNDWQKGQQQQGALQQVYQGYGQGRQGGPAGDTSGVDLSPTMSTMRRGQPWAV